MKTNEQLLSNKIIDEFKEDFQGMTSDNKILIVKIRNKIVKVEDYTEMEFNELVKVIKDRVNDESN